MNKKFKKILAVVSVTTFLFAGAIIMRRCGGPGDPEVITTCIFNLF